jgi:hypothetical protein
VLSGWSALTVQLVVLLGSPAAKLLLALLLSLLLHVNLKMLQA